MRLWRDRDFLKLWTGQTISEIGSRITREGIPLTAVMLLHASPAEMGVLASLNGFAALLFGPVAGLAADRFRLRPILIVADLGRAAMLAIPRTSFVVCLTKNFVFKLTGRWFIQHTIRSMS